MSQVIAANMPRPVVAAIKPMPPITTVARSDVDAYIRVHDIRLAHAIDLLSEGQCWRGYGRCGLCFVCSWYRHAQENAESDNECSSDHGSWSFPKVALINPPRGDGVADARANHAIRSTRPGLLPSPVSLTRKSVLSPQRVGRDCEKHHKSAWLSGSRDSASNHSNHGCRFPSAGRSDGSTLRNGCRSRRRSVAATAMGGRYLRWELASALCRDRARFQIAVRPRIRAPAGSFGNRALRDSCDTEPG